MIDDHVQLTSEDGKADSNNWRGTFSSSVDLRADIRKHLKPQATRATAERMIERGETPLVLPEAVIFHGSRDADEGKQWVYDLKLVNVGPMPAFDLKLSIDVQGIVYKGRFCQLPVIFPAVSAGQESVRTAQLNLDQGEMVRLTEAAKSFKTPLWYRCHIEYSVSVGLTFKNMVQGNLWAQNDAMVPKPPYEFAGMNYVGPIYLIRHG